MPRQLPNFLNDHPEVRLVVLDSVAFHFRHDWDDFAMRARMLNCMSQRLANIATNHSTAGRPRHMFLGSSCRCHFPHDHRMRTDLGTFSFSAVVLMNQVTTKINTDKSSYLAPALGESWAHACTNRMMLTWENGERMATLIKSPSRRRDSKPYQITAQGVRGLGNKRPRQTTAAQEGQENVPPAQMRKC